MDDTILSIWLENKVKSFLEETVDTIVGHHQDALQTNEDYRGRQLLELLQNADDAHEKNSDTHKVYIELTNTQLVIKNTGIGFSKDGVESLLTSNLSPKDNNYIGNKGLGFRSILNWAKKIHIYSHSKEKEGKWSFSFSRQFAKDRFNSLSYAKQELARKKAQNNESHPIATLRCPKWDTSINYDNSYTTVITLNLKAFALNEIKEQFNRINENILVFLPSLSEIEIVYDEEIIIYKKIINHLTNSIDEVIVEKYHGEETTLKQWTVHNEKGKIEVIIENDNDEAYIDEKDYHLAVAYQDDLSDNANHLFSFFSTDVPFHIPALVHGTFDLEGNRNQISHTDSNKELLKKLSDLLLRTSEYIASSNHEASWLPLSLIYFQKEKYDDRLNELNFYEYLSELIHKSKLFPCHDRQYRMIKNTLLFNYRKDFSLHNDVHRILKYEKFKVLGNLLLYTDDIKNYPLIDKWSKDFIHDDNISSILNEISLNLTEDERVEIIYFVSKFEGLHGDEYLELLVDDNNNVINKEIAIYTPKTKNTLEFEIPEHINLRFMNRSLYAKLVQKFSSQFRDKTETDSRKLQAILKSFLNIHSYEPDPVIKKIISDTNKSNINEIKAMIKALYLAFSSAKETLEEINVEVPLIDKDNNVAPAKELYFGDHYFHGRFIEKIYKGIDIKYLNIPSELGLNIQRSVEPFFRWLGVNQYIKIKNINIRNNDSHPFINWFKKRTNYDFKLNPDFIVNATSIEYIGNVFNNNNLEDILYWLKLSDGLDKITTKDIKFLTGRSLSYKTSFNDIDKLNHSYFLWEVEDTIPTKSDKKASLRDCVLPDLNLDLSPILETVNVNYKKLEEYGIERGEAKDLLHRMGIYRDFDEIDSNKTEGILRDLYISDTEGKQAKKIYRLILKKYADYKNSELSKIKLKCQNINVYCKKSDVKSYFPASEAYYLDELIYPKAILKNYPLIDIGIRQGQLKIKHIFGVEPLKDLDISLNHELSKENYLNIQDDIDSVKPYILALRLKQLEGKDISRVSQSIKDMRVQLMSTLAVKLNEETILLDEFDYIYYKNIFYLSTKYASLEDLRENINFIDLIPVLFSIVFKVTSDESKYKEIYKDKYHRKHILNTHTDYEADKYLDEAKKLLNIRSHKLEFWNDIAILKQIDKSVTEDTNINELFELTIDVNSINYENLSAESNYEIIKSIFNKDITLKQFNDKSTLKIDFKPYYERKLFSMLDRLRKVYKAYIWDKLNTEETNNQKELKKKWNNYEGIEFTNIKNDFHFDVDDYFSQCLYQTTKVFLDELSNFKMIDFELYYFIFRENKDENLLDVLWKKNDEGLSYFDNNHEELNKHYLALEKTIIDESTDIINSAEPEFTENEAFLPSNSEGYSKPSGRRKQPNNTGTQKNHHENTITGQSGEEIVYNYLKSNSDFSRVDWVSDYAKKAGVNADGKDGYGYDITYWDKNDTQFFVEVKSTKTNNNGSTISFNMSINEYNIAKEKGEYYKIYYVSSIGDNKPKVKSFTFNDKTIKKDVDNYIMTTNLINIQE